VPPLGATSILIRHPEDEGALGGVEMSLTVDYLVETRERRAPSDHLFPRPFWEAELRYDFLLEPRTRSSLHGLQERLVYVEDLGFRRCILTSTSSLSSISSISCSVWREPHEQEVVIERERWQRGLKRRSATGAQPVFIIYYERVT